MNDLKESVQNNTGLDKDFADEGVFLLEIPHLGRKIILKGVKTHYSPAAERIYFTGTVQSGVNSAYLLGCLKPDGTLDTAFGTNGITSSTFIERTPSGGHSITLLPDGKILLVGHVFGQAVPALARFTADGKHDTEFGANDGYVILRMPGSTQDQILADATNSNDGPDSSTSVAALDDGTILVVHTYTVTHTTDTRAYLFVLNSDGSLDQSFNQTGYVQVIYPGVDQSHVKLRSGFIDGDKTIVVAGYLAQDPASKLPLMARFSRDGRLVPGFGAGGFFAPPQSLFKSGELHSVIGQPNNKLLGIGSTADGRGLLISLEPNGEYNIQFNGAQPLLTQLGQHITYWKAGAMQPDGKIVVCGAIKPADQSSPGVVARLLSDGRLDETFHGLGWASTRVGGVTILNALALQDDGKIVVAGVRHADADMHGVILRYHANSTTLSNNEGQLDPSFGKRGLALLEASETGGPSISPKGLGVDAAGRVYIAGHAHLHSDRTSYCCMRMSANGVVDHSFGQAGYVTGEFASNEGGRAYSTLNEVAVLSDGKILLIGDYHDGSFASWTGLVRLLADGRRDQGFGDNGQVLIPLGSLSTSHKQREANSLTASLTRSFSHGPVLPDGKILVLGQIYDGLQKTQSMVIRLMPDGALDTSFNQTGSVRFAHPDFLHTVLTDIAVDHEGKYALSGYCSGQSAQQARALFSKIETTGALDTSFATAGYLLIEPNSDDQHFFIHQLIAQTDTHLLGIGYEHPEGEHGLLINRKSDGSKNTRFNNGEPLLTRLDGQLTRWASAISQQDASILVHGCLSESARAVVAKFTDRGELDTTLGTGKGWLQFNVEAGEALAALFDDRSVLFLGTAMVSGRRMRCVARGLLTTMHD
ncbi:hypothetical protein [Pseudomonas sp.]|uniref:hypothetical protein n=1 Tax=Pseudomonas sp. TaxID=306 RepID=UPI003BB727F9